MPLEKPGPIIRGTVYHDLYGSATRQGPHSWS